jgi:hypothetical protein
MMLDLEHVQVDIAIVEKACSLETGKDEILLAISCKQ